MVLGSFRSYIEDNHSFLGLYTLALTYAYNPQPKTSKSMGPSERVISRAPSPISEHFLQPNIGSPI